ncbi:MAG: TIGR00282 family metallophosphoesterase [Candidatus Cloacimonetes bacterium]|jgi:metallophosphoesterase (TIGR00282 family)|nr:TIGR00282 family metallophosphoesterase [Candidatus Cloacimonadota bacterium]NLO44417.1 TIGR00282 family metallophosphoesterase [Candidatus Cloacimonadota bacterium]
MRILFFGDVFGKPGRQLVIGNLPALINKHEVDFVLANCENLADGRGVTEKTLKQLIRFGVDGFTSGNHLWDREESFAFIAEEPKLTKPLNFPKKALGNRSYIMEKNGKKLEIITLCGQVYMPPANSPFEAFDEFWESRDQSIPLLVDFHGESTAEKRAFAWYVDERASALLGTHTHVQTADEEILPGGTAYITDVGMTGGHDSVIGVKKDIILQKMTTAMPIRYETSYRGTRINAVLVDIDETTNRATSITRINTPIEV